MAPLNRALENPVSSASHPSTTLKTRSRPLTILLTALAVVAGLLLASLTASSAAAATCNTSADLALNHPPSASSVENASFPPGNAFDGNLNTRWSSQFSDPQWIQVDLGSVQSICQVVLHWE